MAKEDVGDCLAQCDGLVNATPVGHHSCPGSAFPSRLPGNPRWAFDAVYTPVMTPFLSAARDSGCQVITGFELFLCQGIEAFGYFTGIDASLEEARRCFG